MRKSLTEWLNRPLRDKSYDVPIWAYLGSSLGIAGLTGVLVGLGGPTSTIALAAVTTGILWLISAIENAWIRFWIALLGIVFATAWILVSIQYIQENLTLTS